MASSKDFLDFIIEQLSALPDITYRKMMGEYIIYYRDTVIGGIYDNRFLVKPTASALKIISNATPEIPYLGGKPMLMIPNIENPELLNRLISAIYNDLSKAKNKKIDIY